MASISERGVVRVSQLHCRTSPVCTDRDPGVLEAHDRGKVTLRRTGTRDSSRLRRKPCTDSSASLTGPRVSTGETTGRNCNSGHVKPRPLLQVALL